MRIIKRGAAILFLAVIGSLTLSAAGCGVAKEPAPRAKAPVEIRVAFWGGPDEVNIISGAIDEWQRGKSDIAVRLEHTPYRGYIDKLLTRIAGRSSPDIICTEVDLFVAFQSKGVLLELDPYIAKDAGIDKNEFYPGIINRFTVNGKLYALPRDTAPYACVYYNKKLFDEANVPYPTDDWDVFDMLEKAKRLTKSDARGSITQYGFYTWAWQNFVYTFGGSLTDSVTDPKVCTLDSEASLAGLGFYADLINKYRVHPTSTAMTNLAMGVQGMFMTGRLAMFASGIWETPALRKINDFEWDIAMFPKGPGGRRAFGTGGSGYCILKDSKHPAEAFEVIKALAGKKSEEMLADTGLAQPALAGVAQGAHWALCGGAPHNKKMLCAAMDYVIYEPFHPRWREAKELYINPELDLVFNGQRSAPEAVKSFIGKVNRLLKR